MASLFTYFKHARAELQHVVWPTPRQTGIHVALILLISAFTALFIAGIDYVFSRGLAALIGA
jgi:preprotein translocase SecE subunit